MRNVVDATILAINNKKTKNEIINVGSGKSILIIEIAKYLRDKINPKVRFLFLIFIGLEMFYMQKQISLRLKKWVGNLNLIF